MSAIPTRILGVHAPDREGPRAYQRGMLLRWLKHFGRSSGDGALAATKVYDEGWLWREGKSPALSSAQQALLDDARIQGFQGLVSYCMFTKLRPGDTAAIRDKRKAVVAAFRDFFARLPKGTAVLLMNERETSWNGTLGELFDLEALFGSVARECGMLWYVGGDLVEANTIETIKHRMVAWARYDVEPAAVAFHSYGQGGTIFRHVRDIMDALFRVAGRKFKVVWTEWAWGFPGEGKTRADRVDLDHADAGAWCGGFALALAEADAQGVFFTLDGIFSESGLPTAAGEEFAYAAETGEVVGPRIPPRELSRTKTLRYLSAARSTIGAWWAGLFA